MLLLLVRHAHAGSKERWEGDDRVRPLSPRGREAASALVPALLPFRPERVVSSPLVRCVETVAPLARRLRLAVETSDRLLPDAGEAAVALVEELARGTGAVVLCTHGETIETLQRSLSAQGLGWGPGSLREKGSVWVLRATDGRFTGAEYLPPARGRGATARTAASSC